MDLLRRFVRAADTLSRIIGLAASVLIPAMVAVISVDVFCRYVLDAPTVWAFDTSIFLFGYAGLLGGAYAMREKAHITVDVLYARLPPRGRALMDVLSGLLAFFFLGLVIVYGWRAAITAIEYGSRRSTEWGPPIGHYMMLIPVSAALLLIQTLANWIRSLYRLLCDRELET